MQDEGSAVDRLLIKLGRVVVPPHMGVTKDGKTYPVKGYSYNRAGRKKSEKDELREYEGVPEGPQPGDPEWEAEAEDLRKMLHRSGGVTRAPARTAAEKQAAREKVIAELKAAQSKAKSDSDWDTYEESQIPVTEVKVGDFIAPHGERRVAKVTRVKSLSSAGQAVTSVQYDYLQAKYSGGESSSMVVNNVRKIRRLKKKA